MATNYSASKTVGKGAGQLLNVLTSTVFSSAIVLTIGAITGKNIDVESIQEGIAHISGSVVFLTPIVSAGFKMVTNWFKNRK